MKVTLVPKAWAKKGRTFLFHGSTEQCRGCKLTAPCLALDSGFYKIEKVRTKSHTCPGPFDGTVLVVEVAAAGSPIALTPSPGTLEGATVTLRGDSRQKECDLAECAHYQLCHPAGLPGGSRVTIESLGGKLNCPKGFALKTAEITITEA